MSRLLNIQLSSGPINGTFMNSRGAKTTAGAAERPNPVVLRYAAPPASALWARILKAMAIIASPTVETAAMT